MRACWFASTALLLLSPLALAAQDKYVYGNESLVPDPLSLPPAQRTDLEVARVLALTGDNLSKLAALAGGAAGAKRMLAAIEDSRLDKQTGATSSSEGTTSVVSKGVVSQVLALAVEEGALTRTDSKTISTFHGNALGIARLLAGAEPLPYCPVIDASCGSRFARALNPLSFSISLDTSPGSQSRSTASPSGQTGSAVTGTSSGRVSGWGLRYDFHVRRPINSTEFVNQMRTVTGGEAYLNAAVKLFEPIRHDDRYLKKWLPKYERRLRESDATADKELAAILTEAGTELVAIAKRAVPDFDAQLAAFETAMGNYFGDRDRAYEELMYRWTYSVEYADDRPLNEPSQSSVRLIVSGRLDDAGTHQLTFNSAASWYDHAPPQGAVRRFRDAEVSLQLDVALTPDKTRVGAALNAGYYFQWMADDALLSIPSGDLAPGTSIALPGDASVLLRTKGTVSIGQIGVTLSFKNGVRFPLTLTYANRTELLKANTVRGHFGLSYDLDSLFVGK